MAAMGPSDGLAARAMAFTRRPVFAALLAALYALHGARAVLAGRLLNDEGLLTWLLASYLYREPITTLFFLKAKPAMGVMNLPGAALGLRGFLLQHTLLGAAGVVLAFFTARAWKLREPGFAALVVAASPLYLAGGPAGVSNIEGVLAFFTALWLSQRPAGFITGMVLSALPLVRSELALVSAAMALYALPASPTRARFVAGLVVLPARYLLGGALYHRDALWPAHYLPVYGRWPAFANAQTAVGRLNPREAVLSIALVSPAFVMALRSRADTGPTRLASALIAAYVIVLFALPLMHLGFGFTQRYLLVMLPPTALLAAGVLDDVLTARRGPPSPALRLAVMALLALWPAVAPVSELGEEAPRTRAAVAWMRAHPELVRGRVIYTNDWLLDTVLHERPGLDGARVCFVMLPDMSEEIRAWTNPHNGQRARVFALMRWRLYGPSELLEDLRGSPRLRGGLLLERHDPRFHAGTLGVTATPLWHDDESALYRLGDPLP